MSLNHHNLVAWQRADDLFKLEIEIKQVGAPLAGLIRSTRLVVGTEVAGAVLLIGFLVIRFA